MVNYRGRLIAKLTLDPHSPDMAVSSVVSASYTAVDITDNENFAAVLDHHVKVDTTTAVQTARLTTSQWKLAVDSELAWRWGIPPHKAKRTVQRTTRRGVRTLQIQPWRKDSAPMIACSSTMSRHGNKCAQIFSSDFGWSRAYPMKTKGEAHEALSLMFQREGVPPLMVMDGSKEQTLGKFRQKL